MKIKSLICPIENKRDVERALTEIDNFSAFYEMDSEQAKTLRLIGEELLGMVDGVLDITNGRFWIEGGDDEVLVRLAAEAILGTVAKDELDQVSKNAEYKGFGGFIKKTIDNIGELFRDSGASMGTISESEFGVTGSIITQNEVNWSLSKYQDSLDRDMKAGSWDELEMSVLKKFSKDIKISYRNDRVDIIVYADL